MLSGGCQGIAIDYPAFRAAGLCTSTGVVEAGCKVAIGTRCKRVGMHWTVAGADAIIIALRCCKLSGRFEDFLNVRIRHAELVAKHTPGFVQDVIGHGQFDLTGP